MIQVLRIGKEVGEAGGLNTLVQRFRFTNTSAAALAELLWTAPLVGNPAIFAGKSCASSEDHSHARHLRGFVPAPGFKFDVTLRRLDPTSFVVRFSQPEMTTPYLDGELLWRFLDRDGALFEEQINTPLALERVDKPLTGEGSSIRRWLFFKVGHGAVMDGMTANLAGLASKS